MGILADLLAANAVRGRSRGMLLNLAGGIIGSVPGGWLFGVMGLVHTDCPMAGSAGRQARIGTPASRLTPIAQHGNS
jgi:uncharacterized membrane protein YeaQ/YmgE (transglycosylase-associated protein family)